MVICPVFLLTHILITPHFIFNFIYFLFIYLIKNKDEMNIK